MASKSTAIFWIGSIALTCWPASGQTLPQEVSVCEVLDKPATFDGKLLRLRGTVSLEIEDFTLRSESCDSNSAIWLSFGGDVETRKPGVDLEVDGVTYGLKKNEDFRQLYSLITIRREKKAAYQVTGTLIGTFLEPKNKGGYGHLGCCSLFVISEVMDVVSKPSAKSDFGGTVRSLSGKPLKDVRVVNETVAICCLPDKSQSTTTDTAGHFTLSNPGQVMRFERPSFRPVLVVLHPGENDINVVLGDSKKPEWLIPTCAEFGEG